MAINPLPLAGVGLAAVAIAGGLYATGTGTADTPPGQQTPVEREPEWHSLSEDSDYFKKAPSQNEVADAYKDKYGHTYSRFLVGVETTTAKDGKESHSNQKWWEWALKKKYKDTAENGFAGIDKWDKLRDACKAAYGAEKTLGEGGNLTVNGNSVSKYKEEDFWTFCSSGGTKILTIQEKYTGENTNPYNGDGSSNKYGKTKADKLVADVENDWFWEVQEKRLKEDSTLTDSSNEFTKLHNKLNKKNPDNQSSKNSLREVCKDVYGKTESESNTSHPKASIGKFCTLSGETLN